MEKLEILKTIHRDVFEKFEYEYDKDQYGENEKWVMPEGTFDGTTSIVGDCEDFALACRKLCRDNGIDDTRLVACLTEDGEGHCVLECEGWILDNRFRAVKSRDDIPYTWLAISGYHPGDDWHVIKA